MVDKQRVASESLAGIGGKADRRIVVQAMGAALWIWPAFTLLDAYMCFVAYPGAPFALFVGYRILVELALLAVYRASLREEVSVDRLFRWQGMTYGATALAIALMAVHLGGVRSPYMHGISVVALVWAALVPSHWLRAVPTFLGIGLVFPAVMGIGAAISPAARTAWINAEALIVFGANYVFVVASSSLGVILSHMVWRAQQQALNLGSYQLEELLGRGGMGEVWRAQHRLLARRAAIKLIRPEALGGDTGRRKLVLARFEREAQATASLRSPHTIELYDFGVADKGAFFYVMELLDGLDAAVLVERFGPMPAERVTYLLRQVCDSLGEAHATGLIHRDVKPSNILVCRYGRAFDFVKVLDFGLVKPSDTESPQLTADNVVTGTPAFIAPEQVLGTTLDARSDLYAVGCVAYWLLTGHYVFEGSNAMQVMLEHARGTPVPPSRRTEQAMPQELEQLVMSCLEKDPAKRPQSADGLAEALEEVPVGRSWTQAQARDWWARVETDSLSESDEALTPLRP